MERGTNLKIAAADEEVDFDILRLLQMLQSGINIVQVAMRATLHCNLSDKTLGQVRRPRGQVEMAVYSTWKNEKMGSGEAEERIGHLHGDRGVIVQPWLWRDAPNLLGCPPVV